MEGVGLDVLVPPERVWVGPCVEQHLGGLDVPVEAREGEGLEAVVPVGVGAGGIFREQLAEPVGLAKCGSLEDVKLGVLRKQLVDLLVAAAV